MTGGTNRTLVLGPQESKVRRKPKFRSSLLRPRPHWGLETAQTGRLERVTVPGKTKL